MIKPCGECKWEYPDNLLNQMFVQSGYTPPICGICALEITNRIHGVIRKSFGGEIAEHMRLLAVQWRKKNPQRKPK